MGLTGQTKTLSGVPGHLGPLMDQLIPYLTSRGFEKSLFPSVVPDAASQQPFLDLFTQQNTRNLAEAKEAAGNLSGSGLGNYLGNAQQRASVEQGAFLANLFENRRTQDADRFLKTLLGFGTAGVGPDQHVYQPGFLDYAGGAASSLAGGGAFNSLFGSGGGGGASGPGLPFLFGGK